MLAGKKLPRKEGPFVKYLDRALGSFNVHRQAYYSGTFVGNHVHRTLKVGRKARARVWCREFNLCYYRR